MVLARVRVGWRPGPSGGGVTGQGAEAAIVAGVRAGDADAYEQLVRGHSPRMLAVARRIVRDQEEALDCVQEAFLQAFRHMESFDGRAAIGTWLHRIVVNCALARLRRRDRRKEESFDDLMPEFDGAGCRVEPSYPALPSVEEMLEGREARALVRRSIDQLPDSYRTVLLLRDIEELDTQDVADLLDVSPGTVKTRLHRARAALKKLLEPLFLGESE